MKTACNFAVLALSDCREFVALSNRGVRVQTREE
jgi:hypothetical protein